MSGKTLNEIVVWQDINKQLVDLVMQALKSKPEEMTEQSVQAMVTPYLKQIEQDVEIRLRQTREDEQARKQEKAERIWAEREHAGLRDRLQQCATLKIGKYKSTCHPKAAWLIPLVSLGEVMPEFAGVKVIRTPAQIEELPQRPEFKYKKESHEQLEPYRGTIEIQGFDPSYHKQLIECTMWSEVVSLISSKGTPPSAEVMYNLHHISYHHDFAIAAVLALEKLLAKRHIRPIELVHFFTNATNKKYGYATIQSIVAMMESTSVGNIDGSRRLELLQRKPLSRKQQQQE